ncbi:hypothetical protein BHE74_00049839, partial [Ensete ventricosum]
AWIEILHSSSFPWIALKLSREWTPPMMMLDWASGRWVMGLFAESLVVFKDRHEICRFDVQTVSNLCDLRHRATGESCLIEETAMPEDYRTRKVSLILISQVWILCNDCNDTTEVLYHIIGQKCSHCQSYNTRMISPPTVPQ